MTRDEVEPVAGGRVWTGSQALERKLIDELGGLDAAVKRARRLANLPETTPAREVRAQRKPVPPRALPAAATAGWFGYLWEGIGLLTRAPALTVMELFLSDSF
jgi:ClpP class serine protease